MSIAANRQELRLADQADKNGLIEKRTYQDAVILGPAILVPLEDVTLDSNTFVGDPNGLFIEFPEGAPLQGGIGLRHVTFRRCEFRNVAIAGTSEVLAPIRSQFEFPTAATLQAVPATAQS